MSRPSCYNHGDEYSAIYKVVDGYQEISLLDARTGEVVDTRVPILKEVQFTFCRGCVQYQPPYGAVPYGLIDPKDCEGCQWKPELEAIP